MARCSRKHGGGGVTWTYMTEQERARFPRFSEYCPGAFSSMLGAGRRFQAPAGTRSMSLASEPNLLTAVGRRSPDSHGSRILAEPIVLK